MDGFGRDIAIGLTHKVTCLFWFVGRRCVIWLWKVHQVCHTCLLKYEKRCEKRCKIVNYHMLEEIHGIFRVWISCRQEITCHGIKHLPVRLILQWCMSRQSLHVFVFHLVYTTKYCVSRVRSNPLETPLMLFYKSLQTKVQYSIILNNLAIGLNESPHLFHLNI